jgi:hypothetical protein
VPTKDSCHELDAVRHGHPHFKDSRQRLVVDEFQPGQDEVVESESRAAILYELLK